MKKRDVIKLLEDGIDTALTRIFTGEMGDARRPIMRKRLRESFALGMIHSIAEQTHDHWSVDSLREAMREILTVVLYVRDEMQSDHDQAVHEDPSHLASLLGLPEDTPEEEVLRVYAERQRQTFPPRKGDPPREPEPA